MKAAPAPRRRRTAEEAREAILDAAERRLVASGPAGIRLQEVAADVGVSHPTVLHHFGSREALVEAVVARALDSLHGRLLSAVGEASKDEARVVDMLEAVFQALSPGHARALLWLALSGYAPPMDELRVRSFAEAVHQIRRAKHAGKGRAPTFEDTYFTVLLPALSLLAMSVTTSPDEEEGPCGGRRFRAWLARLIHEHLSNPP